VSAESIVPEISADGIGSHVDFDLHGIVGVRLVDPRPADVRTLTSQIGPLTARLSSEPDITVRFVDDLPETRALTFGAWPDSAAAEDDFYLLRGREAVAARTLLPMDRVGGRCDIVCERRAGHVPHLLAVINLTALAKGVLPLHASAFVHRGGGVLATGWAKGGKTETLLAMAGRGAAYVGDEWVYLTPDGMMHGVPEPIRLWSWQLAQLPQVRDRMSLGTRARLRTLPALAASAARVSDVATGVPASVLRRMAPILARQANVRIPPSRLFGEDSVKLHGRLDHVLLVVSSDQEGVSLQPVPGRDVAARMRASLQDERTPFLAAYRQFRFLFPDRRSPVVEDACAIERDLLEQHLADRPAHLLRHPYPVRLDSLVEPVESLLKGRR
jgi:hypothetical protein